MINKTVISNINTNTVEQLFNKEIFVNNVNSNYNLESIDTIIFLSQTLNPNPLIENKNN